MEKLESSFCGLRFKNPFIIAASPSSDSRDKVERALEAGWGGVVFKTVSLHHEEVRIAYPNMSGIDRDSMVRKQTALYNIDLISERSIQDIQEDMEYFKSRYPDRIIIGSIMASSRGEWVELVRRLEDYGADMIECSMSCPQGGSDGKIPAAHPELMEEVTSWIKSASKRNTPVILKLTPNVTDIAATAKAAKSGGADAVCAIDTVKAFAGVDIESFEPRLSINGCSTWGGLSGSVIKPIALGCVTKIAKAADIPISGVGGISSWQDAAEFMLLGAGTVQVCTAVTRYGFKMIDSLCKGLADYIERKGMNSLEELVGRSLKYIVDYKELDKKAEMKSRIDLSGCVKDHGCVVACRDAGCNAIKINKDNYPEVAEERCKGCGLCIAVCPRNCIALGRK